MKSSASRALSIFGANPPSSPTAVESPAWCSALFSAWKISAPQRSASAKCRRADRHDHEFLEVDAVVGVNAAVEDVHHRHRQQVRIDAADIAIERQPDAHPPPPSRSPG